MDDHGAEIGLKLTGFFQLQRLLGATLVKLRVANRYGGLPRQCGEKFYLVAGEFVFLFLEERDDPQDLALGD